MSSDVNITIDLNAVIASSFDRLLALFNKDSISRAHQRRLQARIRRSTEIARWVHVVGMERPIPIGSIYQPTRIATHSGERVDVSEVLNEKNGAVIQADAGRGKSTFLHWLYLVYLPQQDCIPLLFPLRDQNAIDELVALAEALETLSGKRRKQRQLVLLIDGYDEIRGDERTRVGALLTDIAASESARYVLTCRRHFTLLDITARSFFIQDFTREDALGYLQSFANAYKADFKPEDFLDQIFDHGFGDLTQSPLLLALLCILKTGPMPSLPKNTIGLLRRALDTLTLRWDLARGVSRESSINLDGEERIRCLMRIAYHMKRPEAGESAVIRATRDHLLLLQRDDINPELLLREMAHWYGLLVPIPDANWVFVHKSLHDFLAARFWVESGRFKPSLVKEWDARSAYAVCLVPDSTTGVVASLTRSRDLNVFAECLQNNALFDPGPVAAALADHYKAFHKYDVDRYRDRRVLAISTRHTEIFRLVSSPFLEALLEHTCILPGSQYRDYLIAASILELRSRRRVLPPFIVDSLARIFGDEGYEFRFKGEVDPNPTTIRDMFPNAS